MLHEERTEETVNGAPLGTDGLLRIAAKKAAAGRTSVAARWKRLNRKSSRRCDGIEVMISTDRDFTSCRTAVVGARTASCKIGGLSRKTTHYVKVRTYRFEDDTKIVGKWSRVRRVRTR